ADFFDHCGLGIAAPFEGAPKEGNAIGQRHPKRARSVGFGRTFVEAKEHVVGAQAKRHFLFWRWLIGRKDRNAVEVARELAWQLAHRDANQPLEAAAMAR